MKFNVQRKIEFFTLTTVMSAAVLFVLSLTLNEEMAVIFLGFVGRQWELTFQVVMWVFFVAAFLLTAGRAMDCQSAQSFLNLGYLPTDEETILQSPDLHPIFSNVRQHREDQNSYLANLIYMAIIQFQTSKSVEQTTSLVTSQLNMLYEDLDLKYAFIRYFAWLLPTIGFIGTVYGISITVAKVGSMNFDDPSLLTSIAASLAIAFNTTLVALVQTSILLLFTTWVQRREESLMNQSGQYVLSNLVNRLYRDW